MPKRNKLTPANEAGTRGRPSKYNEEGWQKLLSIIEGGVRKECRALALVPELDIYPQTLSEWKREYPELSAQIEAAHRARNAKLEVEARERAAAGDGNMIKFLLQTAMPEEYSERRQVDITAITADVTADKVNDATRKQLREIAKRVFDASGTAPADED